jgi:hypothetical protein
MARITDLAKELIAQIVEGLFEDAASLSNAFLARGISSKYTITVDGWFCATSHCEGSRRD